MDALLNTIETLVIVGDPDLNSNNQNEWIPLISKCLPCKTLPKQLNCPQDAKCLQHVAACFEEFTLHSTLFQVSSAAESKRWLPLRIHRRDPRCICSASMSVRMWTTTSEEVTVPPGDGDKKDCAFYQKSAFYNRLLSITNLDPRFSLSGNPAQLSVLEAQTSDGLHPYLSMDENATDVTRNGPASPQATFLIIHPVPAVETPPLMNVEPASRCDTISARGAPDEADSKNHDDQYPDPRKTTQDFLATEASIEPESLPCCDDGIESLESTIFEQAENEDSVTHGMQQTSSGVLSVLLPPVARRSPFLSMRVPGRDARFFGREDLLIPLEALLAPVSMLPSGHLASLDSGAVIVLHGKPGVGKSAIALELTYRIQATFDHVFWIRASSKLHLAQSFHEAAVSLGLARDRIDHNHESSRQKLMAWLSTTTSNWLLVFNDADEPQILPPFMPNRRRGSIILTSRQPFGEGLYFKKDECLHTFQIDPFAVEDATEFMLSLAPSAFGAANPAADLATLKTIAEDCHCLPLTLRLVGTNLSRRSSSKNKRIMAILEQHAGRVLTSQPSSPLFYANLSPASCALANVITFLDPYCINDAILLGAQRYKDIPLSAFPTSDHDYFNAKNELIAHALLAANADSSVLGIHRVMARSIRAKLDPENFRGSFHIASRLLEGRWPSRRKMKNIVVGNWPEFDALHCHVHELSKIFVEYDRERKKGTLKQELSNDSYLKVLFLSTW